MRTFKAARSVYSLAYAPDRSLWIGTGAHAVLRWDVLAGRGEEVFRIPSGSGAVYALHQSADGSLILACGFGGVLWDVRERRELPIMGGSHPATLYACLSPDGGLVFFPAVHDSATLWDRAEDDTIDIGGEGTSRGGAFSPDSRLLAVRRFDEVEVYDLREEARLATLGASWVETMLFTPDGSRLLMAAHEWITVWDTATRALQARFRTGPAFVRSLAIHPGGQLLAVGGEVRDVSLWTLDGQPRGRFDWGVGKVRAVAFAPDGMTAAVGGSSGNVAVWDIEEDAP